MLVRIVVIHMPSITGVGWSRILLVCTWRHGGHVSVENNCEKIFREFDSIIMQNLNILLLFCRATCLPYRVSATQE